MKENIIKCENDYCENEALGDDEETGFYFPSCESCMVDHCNW